MDFRRKRIYRSVLFHQIQSTAGDSFQELFAKYMRAVHGDDFTEVVPAGRLGDEGCDGYQRSSKTVYQCYGKQVNSALDGKYISKKIKADFEKAMKAFSPNLMTHWKFVHNIREAVPSAVLKTIEELQINNPLIKLGLMGPSAVEDQVFSLAETVLDDLLGLPEDPDSPLNATEVQRLLKGLGKRPSRNADSDTRSVPLEKIELNNLSESSTRVIRDNTQYAAQVLSFVNNDADPQFGDNVAAALNRKYRDLRAESRDSDYVMDGLILFILGDHHSVRFSDVKHAEAIIAYFFSECEVFDNLPEAI